MPLRLDLRRRTSPADTLRRAAAAEADAVTQIQIELCEIAAPVDAEALRGQAVARWLRSSGYEVQHDAIGNVIARRPGRSAGPAVALSAHLDSVFPAHQPVRVARPGEPDPYRATQSDGDTRVPAGELRAPGIADDAAGTAVTLKNVKCCQKDDWPMHFEPIQYSDFTFAKKKNEFDECKVTLMPAGLSTAAAPMAVRPAKRAKLS